MHYFFHVQQALQCPHHYLGAVSSSSQLEFCWVLTLLTQTKYQFLNIFWLVLAVTLGVHPMLAQELVTFECLLSCMCNTNFTSVQQGHRIQRQSWEQEIPLHLVGWMSRVMVHSVQSLLGFMFVSYNFQFLLQDFLIQTGNFCLVSLFF